MLSSFLLFFFLSGCLVPRNPAQPHPPRLAEAWQVLEEGNVEAARAIFRRFDTPGRPDAVRGEALYGLGLCTLSEDVAHIPEETRVMAAVSRFQRALPHLRGSPLAPPCSLTLAESYITLQAFDLALQGLERVHPFLVGADRTRAAALLALLHEKHGQTRSATHWWSLAGNEYDSPRFRSLRDRIVDQRPTPDAVVPKLPVREPRRAEWPRIVTRAQWNARPWKRDRIEPMERIDRITIHHTADTDPPDVSTVGSGGAYLRVQQHHAQKNRGWADIGYHFIIDKQGVIYEGRPLRFQGAHAGNNQLNQGNVGIALIGNFDRSAPPAPQIQSLQRLVLVLGQEHGIPGNRIEGHREVRERAGQRTTICPGRYLERLIPSLRGE